MPLDPSSTTGELGSPPDCSSCDSLRAALVARDAREVCLCGHEADLHDGECEGSRLAAPGSEQPCECGNFRPAWAAWQERADVAERALVARDAELAEAREDRDKWQRLALDANGKLAVALGHENALEAEVTQLRAERDAWRLIAGEALAGVVPPEQAPQQTDSGGDKVASSGGGS